ncbi:MAG: amidohydrolase family protein [Desulfovibrio sp.]|nr:amidohydrolase family protein [Desulfovibrio sp.]
MLQVKATTSAIRAKTIIPLAGENAKRGQELLSPLKKIDNGALLLHEGKVVSCGKAKGLRLPSGSPCHDLGEVTLIPGLVNAHTHLDLSCLAGKTRQGQGFSAWLTSLIPLLHSELKDRSKVLAAMDSAVSDLAACGTAHAGNVLSQGGELLSHLVQKAEEVKVSLSHFLEWLGYEKAEQTSLYPPNLADALAKDPSLKDLAWPCGHALYSTSPKILQKAHAFCQKIDKPFSLHLAESPEEEEMLTRGEGPLFSIYQNSILPKDWQPPRLKPLAYALQLGLLGPRTLAVHCVNLEEQDLDILALTGTPVCLCPRSNHNLGVGLPKVKAMLKAGLLLCLGTDGLTSNQDLNVLQEALFLRETLDLPAQALIRLLTVNGAKALGLAQGLGRLELGSPARFAVLPKELEP